MNKDVWFGYHLPPEGKSFSVMKEAIQNVETLGFDVFTITDHLMNMALPQGKENHPLECWTLLAGLAAITEKIRVGPLVSCYGYRSPTILAKMATTVDIISNGRLIMGIGAGWHEAEFKGFFGEFPPVKERVDGMKDTLEIVSSMFQNNYTTYKGKVFSVQNTLNSPSPVQSHVPMMVGAFGKRTISIATEYADIIHCLFEPTEEKVKEQKAKILAGCQKHNRDPQDIRMGAGYQVWLNPSPSEIERRIMMMMQRSKLSRADAEKGLKLAPSTPEAHIENLGQLTDLGVGFFTFSGNPEKIQLFSDKVLKKL